MKYVVIFGTLANGVQSVHGSFQDFEHANQWAKINGHDQPFTITLLRTSDDDVERFPPNKY